MNWGSILDEIKRTLKEPATGGHWTDAELLRRANMGQREIVRKTHCLRETDTGAVSVLGQSEYSKPSNCLRLLRVYYKYPGQRLYPVSKAALDIASSEGAIGHPWTDDQDTPTNYIDEPGASIITLYPKPSAAGDTIGQERIVRPADMSVSGSVPFNSASFMEDYHGTVATYVIWKCMFEDGDNRWKECKGEFYDGLASINRDLKRRFDAMDTFDLIRPAVGRRRGPLPIHEG